MRIGFVSRGGLDGYAAEKDEKNEKEEKADILLFAFDEREVSYERELKGETDYFERVARLSRALECVVVCGVITNARGHKRRSALVAENGTLLGVADMLNVVDGEYAGGAALGVYQTKAGRIGVIVSEDLRFPDVAAALTACGADLLVCPYGEADGVQSAVVQSHAYCFGVPVCFCGAGYAVLAEPSGNIVFSSFKNVAVAQLRIAKEYHLVETRRRLYQKKQGG